jgi:8-oxo-dGTP pyrophosphatase MutT (NUDIX family)
MRQHGPWVIHDSAEKFRNNFVTVTEDRVTQPDGSDSTFATVALNPGIAVLAINDGGEVQLTRQFRYATGADSVEVVCGAVEPGEDALAAAKRELREEAGFVADTWTDLGGIDTDTSILRGPVRLFLARDLSRTGKNPDPSERIASLTVPFDEALSMVHEGAITHAPSCVLILKAARYLT